MVVLTLDAEDYLAIFHPGSVKLIRTLKGINSFTKIAYFYDESWLTGNIKILMQEITMLSKQNFQIHHTKIINILNPVFEKYL